MRRRWKGAAAWGLGFGPALALVLAGGCASPGPAPRASDENLVATPSPFVPRPDVAPHRFVERELTIPSDPPLSASLSMPRPAAPSRSAERPAAALLVAGWGTTERDGTVGPNKPMRDLAWGLASRGIAVLRYDPPRTLLSSSRDRSDEPTVRAVVVEPALAAARWLLRHPEVDGRRVVAVGHSVGGLAVARLAEREPALAGFVVMAAASRPLEEVLVAQLRHVSQLDGVTTAREQAMIAELELQGKRVAELAEGQDVAPAELPLGLPVAFWLDLQSHPLATLLAAERRPVLVVHAGRDYQVTDPDFAGWKALLAGDPHASFRRYPALNHLLMPSSGALSPVEYRTRGHLAAEVVDDLADWIASLEPQSQRATGPHDAPSPR